MAALHAEICGCRACPRLVAWREEVGRVKRRAYRDWDYWAKPVPGFGDPRARIAIVGLAPGAHGANRTGRMFTGDRSGQFLYAGLFRAGLANQPTSETRDDGLELRGVFITAPVRCVPPDNLPLPDEIDRCRPFFDRELDLIRPRVYFALGAIGWRSVLDRWVRQGWPAPRPLPKFAHGGQVSGGPQGAHLVGCFHVSQQNTQTGRLTPRMFDRALAQALALAKES